MTQNKALVTAAVLASVFFVIILYLLYLLNLKNTQPIVSNSRSQTTGNFILPSVSPTDTLSNWKTYENKKLGFLFKYPADLKIEETNNFANSPGKWGLTVWRNGSVYFIVDEHNSNGYFNEVVKTPLKFGNNNYQYFNEPGDGEGSYNYDLNKKIEVVSSLKDLHSSDPQFTQILSTFKFTTTASGPLSSPRPTGTMSVYNNPKYGISFSYPKDCKVIGDQNSHLFSLLLNGQIVSFIAQNNPQNLNPEDLFSRTISSVDPGEIKKHLSVSVKTFNQNKFTLISQDPEYFSHQSPSLTSYHIVNNGYDFGFSFNDNSNNLVTQILSTFKFTNDNSVPQPISNLFNKINTQFSVSLTPTQETNFYSPAGMVAKPSWKIDLLDTKLGKDLTSFLRQELTPNDLKSGGIGGGGIDAYETNVFECYHTYMSDMTTNKVTTNFLTCALK